MKKFMIVCSLVLGVSLMAASVQGSVLDIQNNRIDFLNWEDIGLAPVGVDLAPAWDGSTLGGAPTGNPGAILQLDVGDTLGGIFQAQTIGNDLGGPITQSLTSLLDPSLTGHFSIMVVAKRLTGLGYEFDFGPNPAFAPFYGLPGGTMLAMYEDLVTPGAQDFTQLGATHAINVATVTDGTLLMALGMTAAPGVSEYWISEATTDLPALAGGGSAEFFYGLSLLVGGSLSPAQVAAQLSPFLTPVVNPVTAPYAPGGILPGGFVNDFVGEGDVSPIAIPPGVYPVFSDDPSLINVIPEPASIIIWGLLGTGCAGGVMASRRKRRAPWTDETRQNIHQIIDRGRTSA